MKLTDDSTLGKLAFFNSRFFLERENQLLVLVCKPYDLMDLTPQAGISGTV